MYVCLSVCRYVGLCMCMCMCMGMGLGMCILPKSPLSRPSPRNQNLSAPRRYPLKFTQSQTPDNKTIPPKNIFR